MAVIVEQGFVEFSTGIDLGESREVFLVNVAFDLDHAKSVFDKFSQKEQDVFREHESETKARVFLRYLNKCGIISRVKPQETINLETLF